MIVESFDWVSKISTKIFQIPISPIILICGTTLKVLIREIYYYKVLGFSIINVTFQRSLAS